MASHQAVSLTEGANGARVSAGESRIFPLCSLDKIWELSDKDKDGFLDKQDFLIAYQLTEGYHKGRDLPEKEEYQHVRSGYFHIVR